MGKPVKKSEAPMFVEQYKSFDGDKAYVLKEMDKWAARGWKLKSFGWSNGFQGGWYALMTRLIGG